MAAKAPKPFQIAVCGLTSSVYMQSQQGQGAGKSVLCNRFVRPNADDLLHNHPSVLNHSDYGGTVVNNTHFLYWGEKTMGLDNGEEVKMQIIEHTEFIDDSTFKPFSFPKPYHKRCSQLKIQSGGKVAYIHPDQLSLPENYKASSFPDKFLVDGFLVCIDISCEKPDIETEFVEILLSTLVTLKKPVVAAFTKYDIAKPSTVQAMQDVLAKMKKQAPPIVEVSAQKGVNVDLCFLILAHLIDSKKPSSRLVTYTVAKQHMDERIASCERSFQDLLDRDLKDFTLPLEPAMNKFSGSSEYKLVVELCGTQRVKKLIQAKLNYVKKTQVQKLMDDFQARIPALLAELLPDLELEATPESCRERLKQLSNFSTYFCEEKNWEENIPFLARATPTIPFSVMSDKAADLVRAHVDKVVTAKRQRLAYDKLKLTLSVATQLKPGAKVESVFREIGLEQEAKLQPRETLAQLYREKMAEVEAECTKDFEELLLEHVYLFNLGGNIDMISDEVAENLKECPPYKRLEYVPNVRQSVILKTISHLQFVDKGPYNKSHFTTYLEEAALGKDNLYSSKQWISDNTDTYINIAIIARLETSATYLSNDIKGYCGPMGRFELDGYTYRPDTFDFHGDVSTLNSEHFVPQCAIMVANSTQCLEWLGNIARTLFLPGGKSVPTYRGMPVIILAIDHSYVEASGKDLPDNDFYKKVKAVANSLQCVVVGDKPIPFVSQRLVSQVEPVLRAIINSTIQCQEILTTQPLDIVSRGFNIAVCALPESSISPEPVLCPLTTQQLVCYEGTALHTRIAIEKQHRTCVLTFHSAFNVADIKSTPRVGYILIYITSRKATLSAIRWLKPQLFSIPTLVVAIRSGESMDNQLMEEGQEYAEKNGCMFMTSEHWKVGCTASFFNKCWFSRLSSWKAQCPSDELKRKDRALPDPRPLPELPPMSGLLASIPVAAGPVPEFTKHSPPLPIRDSYSEENIGSPSPPSLLSPKHDLSSLPRSPSRSSFVPPLEESLYSSPQELASGTKDGTLQRKSRSYLPVQVMDEPGEESEYSTVVDHKTSKPKPPGGSRQNNEVIPLKSPDEEQKPPPGKSPNVLRRALEKISPSTVKTTPPPGEANVQSPSRREFPSDPCKEHAPLLLPVGSPSSSPMLNRRRTPQRDFLPLPADGPQGEYAEINVKRKVSLPELVTPSHTHKTEDKGSDSLQRPHGKIPPPAVKAKPSQDAIQSRFPAGGSEGQLTSVRKVGLERDTTTEGGGAEGVYAEVQKKPKVVQDRASTPTPKPPTMLAKDEEGTGEDSTYAVVQKPKKPLMVTRSADSQVPSPITTTPLKGKLEQDTEEEEGGDTLYSQVNSKKKSTPMGDGDRTPKPPTAQKVLKKTNSVPRYDHLPHYDHLPSDVLPGQGEEREGSAEEMEPMLPRQHEPESEPMYAVATPKKKPPPLPATKPLIGSERRERSVKPEPKSPLEAEATYALPNKKLPFPPVTKPQEPLTVDPGNSEDEEDDEEGKAPLLPSRNYNEDDIEGDAPPPLPPRKYSFSDIEDNDEEVISDNEQDIQEISTTDQVALYASVCQKYQTQKASSATAFGEEFSSLYDTLDNLKNEAKGIKTTSLSTPSGGAATLPGIPPETVFTPQQLKVIKQQQKLLAQLQKKMEKEQERRRKQEEKKRQKEKEEEEKKMGKGRGKKKGKSKKQERVRYFGSPLEQVAGEDGVPVFVKKCTTYVEERGLQAEGIYRVSGKKEDVLSLQDKFDEDNNLNIDFSLYCEAAVSSALKAFFKLLPFPLIVDTVATKMLSIVSQSGTELSEQQLKTQEVLRTLPRCNLNTLHHLVHHLHLVQKHADKNKMNASNLAIVFWPTLLRPPILDLADPSKQMGWQLAMMRIIEHPEFVPCI